MTTERRDPLRGVLGRFVPEGLVERLEETATGDGPLPTLAERREVAVLFADLSGFTSLSENLEPEAVVAILDRFFAVVGAATERFGGSIDKFLGDAALVVFGAPGSVDDAANRAVAAAIEIQAAMPGLSAFVPGGDVRATCAVELGEVVAAILQAGHRAEYTVIGDAVNVAARLQKACTPGETLIGARAAARIDAGRLGVHVESLQPIPSKGKALPILAYRLRSLAEKALDEPGLCGRRAEVTILDERLDRLREGEGGTLVLLGRAGMGKSALLDAACRRGWSRGFKVVERSVQGRAPGAFLAALFEDAGHLVGTSRLAAADVAALPSAAAEALAHLAGSAPFVVRIDDLDRLDAPSRAALAAAAPFLAARRGLLLAAVSVGGEAERRFPSGVPGLEALAGSEALGIGPLPVFDAKRLLALHRPADAENHPLLERLVRDAGGVPRELLRLAGVGTDATLAQVDGLPRAERQLLAAAAVLEGHTAALLATVTGTEPGWAADGLRWLARAGILDERNQRYVVRDSALRQALVAGLPAPERMILHGRAANALRAEGQDEEAWSHDVEGPDPHAGAAAAAALASRYRDFLLPAEAERWAAARRES